MEFAVSESGKVALLATAQEIVDDPNYTGETWYNGECGCAMVRTIQNLGHEIDHDGGTWATFKGFTRDALSYDMGVYYSLILSRETGVPAHFWEDKFKDWSIHANGQEAAEALTNIANGVLELPERAYTGEDDED